MCDLLFTTVREVRNEIFPYCFEIVYANIRSYYIQAEGLSEYTSWLNSIRSAIEAKFLTTEHESHVVLNCCSLQDKIAKSSTEVDSHNFKAENASKIKTDISEIISNNKYCADCSAPNPDWVSLNIGCVVCIDCSGVHR